MPAPRKFTPQPIAQKDYDAVESILAEWINHKSRDRVIDEFQKFCTTNEVRPAAGIFPWVGQMLRADLARSTIETYFTYVLPVAKRDAKDYKEFWKLKDLQKAVQAHHANTPHVKRARMVTDDDIKRIDQLEEAPRMILKTMLVTGCRVADIVRWERAQIRKVTTAAIDIEIRVNKGRRKMSRRKRLAFKPRNVLSVEVPQDLIAFWEARSDPHEFPFKDWDVNKINRLLPRGVTTYSFRRHYIHDIRVYCDNDTEKMKEFTLHLNPKILDAHYHEEDMEESSGDDDDDDDGDFCESD
jgi:integrase